jgi:hypothetical protein
MSPIPVTERGSYSCEMLGIQHRLGSRLIDDDGLLASHKGHISLPQNNFYFSLCTPGLSSAGRIREFDKIQLPYRILKPRPSEL